MGNQVYRLLSAIILIAVAAMACHRYGTSFTSPARIISLWDTTRVEAPDTVAIGTPFRVSFRTFAGGCTRHIARTEVRVSEHVAYIRPFNTAVRSALCTLDLLFLTHSVMVTFTQPGPSLVRVIGVRPGSPPTRSEIPTQVEKPVYVR